MNRMYTVTFLPQNISIEVAEGTTLLAAEQEAGLEPDAPCGGKGDCGKCKVNIVSGKQTGVVLACQTAVTCDMKVDTMYQGKIQKILTDGFSRSVAVEPGVGREELEKGIPFYLMAFDIGTTTVVGYLLDGKSGKEMAVASMMNPQHQFGADVISRSNYVLEHGGEEMRAVIQDALNRLIVQACAKAGIKKEEILQVSIVGNTCMHHLFLGISPDSLVHAPYLPAVKEGMILSAEECGIHIAPEGRLLMLPNIAGFVGADTVGCMLSIAFDQLEPMTLMIDIGTNGEMVMGNKERMVTTSTAAGPAFEGAHIQCGTGGVPGAVDSVKIEDGTVRVTTIGGQAAQGICGSGLVDAVSEMKDQEIMDMTGRIDEDEMPEEYESRCFDLDGKPAFSLTGQGEDGVFIAQKDLREVQLAKGAIAAGIEVLMNQLGVEFKDIEALYLAGGFGNYIDKHSACNIGLLPPELEERIVPIGNGAGAGAQRMLLDEDYLKRAEEIRRRMEYIELSARPDFQDLFVDHMLFE